MPTYEYTCKKCGENFEVVQSFKEKNLTKHPGDCGGAVQKVFHPSGIVFKGSGFYVTDTRGSSSTVPSAGDGASSGSDSTGSSDSKSSDSKSSGSKSSGSKSSGSKSSESSSSSKAS